MDTSDSLHILRQFKSGPEYNRYTSDQINQIVDYVKQNDQVDLSNNVENLRNGTEKAGLGKFLYITFNLSTTEAQTASHLAALFVKIDLWKWNEKVKGMTFKANSANWQENLRNYYNRGLNGAIV